MMSCASGYNLTSESSEIDDFETKIDYYGGYQLITAFTGYQLINALSYNIKEKTVFIPSEFLQDEVMKTTIELIRKRKYIKLKRYLKNTDKNNFYLPLANGLLSFYKNNFYGAIDYLNENQLAEIQHIVDLLIIDCEYEDIYSRFTYIDYLEKYQKILDTYTLDDNFIKLINYKMKLIRYGI